LLNMKTLQIHGSDHQKNEKMVECSAQLSDHVLSLASFHLTHEEQTLTEHTENITNKNAEVKIVQLKN
jgi:hypothetical protein